MADNNLDLTKAPYFDDYRESDKYYKILFRPGRALQARELNQLQTILQKQLDRLGKHLFKNGTQILPGTSQSVKYNNNVGFIKIQKTEIDLIIDDTLTESERLIKTLDNNWLNKTIKSSTDNINGTEAGIEAEVIGYKIPEILQEDNNHVRLYVKYTKSSSDGEKSTFSPGDTITVLDTNNTSTILLENRSNDFTNIIRKTVGFTSSVEVVEGVYFYNGNFVYVDKQIIFIEPETDADTISSESKWTNNPTISVGLEMLQSIKTFQDDSNLLDNALGSPNKSAPGADRLSISANLIQVNIEKEQDQQNFIKLITISNGEIVFINNSTEYNVLEDTLARRTNDESGDYVVNDFGIEVRDFLRDPEKNNNGVHDISEFKFATEDAAKVYALNKFNVTLTNATLKDGVYYPGTSYDGSEETSFKNLCNKLLTLRIDSGKAYVKGYEITKLSRTSLDIPKSRESTFVNNKIISTNIGSYFIVTDLLGTPSFTTITSAKLFSSRYEISNNQPSIISNDEIGKCNVVFINKTTDAYKVFVTDIKLNSNFDISQVKSLQINDSVFCNTQLTEITLTGSISNASRNGETTNVTITGTSTRWKNDVDEIIVKNDYVKIGTLKNYFKVIENPTKDSELKIEVPTTIEVDDIIGSVYKLETSLSNEGDSGLLFNLPDQYIKTIKTANGVDTDTSYKILKIYTEQVIDNNHEINISLNSLENQTFDSINQEYKVIDSQGNWLTITNSDIPSLNSVNITIDIQGNLKFKFNTNKTGTVTLIVPIQKNKALPRTKTLSQGVVISQPQSEILLGECDVLKIKKISSTKSTQANDNDYSIDITHAYELDDGQRDYYYDIARITLRATSPRPTGKIKVEFEYFEHSNDSNDFFCVDSYGTIKYEDIGSYASSSGIVYNLSDCFDFRRKITTIIGNPPIQFIKCDYFKYIARKDKVVLSSKTKNFELKMGLPNNIPQLPSDSLDGMTICELSNAPYGVDKTSCTIKNVDNKRYTMKDIGKLERRIENLEYYTLLSLLEKETSDMTITDANGNDRFKNGFLVDSFTSFDSSDSDSEEFKCSLDLTENNDARPMVFSDNISLVVDEDVILTNTYKKSGDDSVGHFYTLPFTEVSFIKQKHASKIINVNPFNVATFVGDIKLNPWSDEWWENEIVEIEQSVDVKPSILGNKIYNESFDVVTNTELSKKKNTGKQLLITAGHEFLENIKNESRRKEILRKGTIKVPPGYLNSGDIIPLGKSTLLQNQKSQTLTVTSQKISSGYTQSLIDLGTTTSKAITKSEITDVKYVRSKEIKFSGSMFRPNTKLYAFFDDVEVTKYCKPDGEGKVYGNDLITDDSGKISGLFKIPDPKSEAEKFKTGELKFTLTSSSSNIKDSGVTVGNTKYYAKGSLKTDTLTVTQTRQYSVQNIPFIEQGVTNTSSSSITSLGKAVERDPIAQTFKIGDEQSGGCFITSVDLYFAKVPKGSTTPPVCLELRTVNDDSSPSMAIVGGDLGRVVKDSTEIYENKVIFNRSANGLSTTKTLTITQNNIISKTEVYADSDISLDMESTKFTFPCPIYLEQGKTYAIVLLSDSNEYEVWIAQNGQVTTTDSNITEYEYYSNTNENNVKIGTSTQLTESLYIDGNFYKSNNGKGWLIDPSSSMKFDIFKAKFDIANLAKLKHDNAKLEAKSIIPDGLEISSLINTDHMILRVDMLNHGLSIGDIVNFYIDSDSEIDLHNDSKAILTKSEGHEVVASDVDNFIVKIINTSALKKSDNTSLIGKFGDSSIKASIHKRFEEAVIIANTFEPEQTRIDWDIITKSGFGVNESQNGITRNQNITTSNVSINTKILFNTPNIIKSGDTKTLNINAILSSDNENLSPVIDASRLSLATKSYRLNNPNINTNTVLPSDLLEIVDADVVIKKSDDILDGTFTQQINSKIITGTETNLSSILNIGDRLYLVNSNPIQYRTIKKITDDELEIDSPFNPSLTTAKLSLSSNVTIIQTNDIDTANEMSKLDIGKYLSIDGKFDNKLILDVQYTPNDISTKCVVVVDYHNESNDVTDTFTLKQKDRFINEIAPKGGSCAAKYISKQLMLDRPCSALKIVFDAVRDSSCEIDLYYRTQSENNIERIDDINWTKADFNIEKNGQLEVKIPDADNTKLKSYETIINNIQSFSIVQCKIVMRGGNTSKPPRIKNLKMIALDD